MDYIKELRGMIGHKGIMMPAASVIVADENNRILLQKRADNGLWGYCGGCIEPGEEPSETAARELYEESGLHAEKLELLGVFGGEKRHFFYPNGDEVYTIDCVYVCREYSGELKAIDGESAELLFVPAHEVGNYPLNPPVADILNEFVKKLKGE